MGGTTQAPSLSCAMATSTWLQYGVIQHVMDHSTPESVLGGFGEDTGVPAYQVSPAGNIRTTVEVILWYGTLLRGL